MRRLIPFAFAMALLTPAFCPAIRSASVPPAHIPESLLADDSGAMRSGLILADRAEKEDRVTYGTDPDPAFSQQEQEKEEQEKEDRAWRMLEHMNLYQANGKKGQTSESNGGKQQQ
jgi:hypothetical protein